MPQRSSNDVRVIEQIELGQIKIDTKSGVIFGKQDLWGNNRTIGFKDKHGDYLFSFRYENKCFVTYICRAIWLKENGSISDGLVVVQKDEDKRNNSIDNLELVKNKSKRFGPKFWSDSEIQWLKDNYRSKSLSQLAEECGRSIKAVRHKIKVVDLPRKRGPNKCWSTEENEQLIRLYEEKKTIGEIACELNRTESSVRLHANRELGAFRSDRHLQLVIKSENFYTSLKSKMSRKTAGSKCCLCDYFKHVDLHHIDGNNKNHAISNIASLCPNHHREVESGECFGKKLYCTWWRVYSDGSTTDTMDNCKEIKETRRQE